MVKDSLKEVERIISELGVLGLNGKELSMNQCSQFVKPQLWHNVREVQEALALPQPIADLYTICLERANQNGDKKIDELYMLHNIISQLKIGVEEVRELYGMNQNIRRTGSRLVSLIGQRPVYIWGAGSGGVRTLKLLESIGIEVDGFVDSDASKWQSKVMGLTVYSSSIVNAAKAVKERRPYIIIGSVYAPEIAVQLSEYGFKEELDFWINPLIAGSTRA
ncbi:MAG: hypothetical protein AB1556_00440 [Bacillota bacterium]